MLNYRFIKSPADNNMRVKNLWLGLRGIGESIVHLSHTHTYTAAVAAYKIFQARILRAMQ